LFLSLEKRVGCRLSQPKRGNSLTLWASVLEYRRSSRSRFSGFGPAEIQRPYGLSGHDDRIVDRSTNIDFSVSYNLTPQLRLSVEGQNLTDTPLRYGLGTQRNDALLYVHSGRSFVAGMNYKF
jgi:outer membrane receptor protein involved in Fe transport